MKPKLVKSKLKTCEQCKHTLREIEFEPQHTVCKTCEAIKADEGKEFKNFPEMPVFKGYDIGRHIGISLDHYMRLEKREGFDCLLDDYRTVVLSAEQKEALEKAGKTFVLVTERTGFDMVFSNGMRLDITEEDLPQLDHILDLHQKAALFTQYLIDKRKRGIA